MYPPCPTPVPGVAQEGWHHPGALPSQHATRVRLGFIPTKQGYPAGQGGAAPSEHRQHVDLCPSKRGAGEESYGINCTDFPTCSEEWNSVIREPTIFSIAPSKL